MTIADARALDALATYRGQDAGNLEDLGSAWDRFDRCEFARRVLSSPVVVGRRGGLQRIDGIECVEDLMELSISTADGCSLEPLSRCPRLLSLEIMAHGDLDLSPITTLGELDRLSIKGERSIRTLEPLRGARMRWLDINVGAGIELGFLGELPRLERLAIAMSRSKLDDAEKTLLRRLVARGVAVRAYAHEEWTSGLADLGVYFAEEHGFRVVGDEVFAAWFSTNKTFA